MARMPKMTISMDQLEKYVRDDIARAERYFSDYIEGPVSKRWQQYQADEAYYKKMFARLHEKCSFVSADIRDTIGYIMPDLMRVFWGGQEPVTIDGRTEEDDPEPMRALITWQLERLNDGFLSSFRWMRSACWAGLAFMGVDWVRTWDKREKSFTVDYDTFLEMKEDENIKILDANDYGNGLFFVTIREKFMSKNQPVIQPIPISECIWIPYGLGPKDWPFFARRCTMTLEEIQNEYEMGNFTRMPTDAELGTAKVRSNRGANGDALDSLLRPEINDDLNDGAQDPARGRYNVYRCYARYDINGDKKLENVLVYYIGGRIVSVIENTFERAPVFIISPDPDEFASTGRGIADKIGIHQDMKTAIVKQIVSNIAKNNDRGGVIDIDSVEYPEDFLQDKKWKRVRLGGKDIRQIIQYDPEEPLSPNTMTLLEWIQQNEETASGVNRYKQAVNPRNISKTAGEAEILNTNSNAQIEQIARMFAETGWKDLLQFLVECNQRFIDQDQVIRLENKALTIRKDDLRGKFDLVVSAGLGTGTKQQKIQRLTQRMAMYPGMIQLGIATPKNAYNTQAALLKEEGDKNVNDFITDPETNQPAGTMMPPMSGQIPPGAAE